MAETVARKNWPSRGLLPLPPVQHRGAGGQGPARRRCGTCSSTVTSPPRPSGEAFAAEVKPLRARAPSVAAPGHRGLEQDGGWEGVRSAMSMVGAARATSPPLILRCCVVLQRPPDVVAVAHHGDHRLQQAGRDRAPARPRPWCDLPLDADWRGLRPETRAAWWSSTRSHRFALWMASTPPTPPPPASSRCRAPIGRCCGMVRPVRCSGRALALLELIGTARSTWPTSSTTSAVATRSWASATGLDKTEDPPPLRGSSWSASRLTPSCQVVERTVVAGAGRAPYRPATSTRTLSSMLGWHGLPPAAVHADLCLEPG